jgi:NitT/TauT family transport system permease protein
MAEGTRLQDPPAEEDERLEEVEGGSRWDVRAHPELVTVPLAFVLVIGLWEALIPALGVSKIIMVAPSAIVMALVQLLQTPRFYEHLGVTVWETLAGYAIGVVVALVLGTLISQSRLFEKTLYPYVVAFQAVPKTAIAPLFVIWFGFGLTSKIVIAALVAFFPMLVNVIEGLKSADGDKIDMLRVVGASRWQVFKMVQLPNAMPFVFAGLDVGIVFALLGAIVGEFVGAQRGLGYLILQAQTNLDIATFMAVVVVLAAMGLLAHSIVQAIQHRVAFWARTETLKGA